MIKELVYNNRDNILMLGLRMQKQLVDIANITRIVLRFPNAEYDSVIEGFGDNEVFELAPERGVLLLRLGGIGQPVGTYVAAVIIYSEHNPDGIIWDHIVLKFVRG